MDMHTNLIWKLWTTDLKIFNIGLCLEAILKTYRSKLECLSVSHYHPSWKFWQGGGASPSNGVLGLGSLESCLQTRIELKNNLAYYGTELIMTKIFNKTGF